MSVDVVSTQKPNFIKPVYDHLPAELRDVKQWVAWKAEFRPGNSKPWTKVPLSAKDGYTPASSTRSYGWGSAFAAHAMCERHKLDGVGFVLTADTYVAVDLDNCVDADGKVADWAADIVAKFRTYTERSPSGTGLRLIGRGKLPGRGRKRGGIEVYDRARFVTMTGAKIEPHEITDCQSAVDWLLSTMPEQHERDHTALDADVYDGDDVPVLTPEEWELAVEVMQTDKGGKLWAGDWSDYPSHSEADGALCFLLARHTTDPRQIDRLFRNSGLMRDKWASRSDYRCDSIMSALEAVTPEKPLAAQAERLAELPDKPPVSSPPPTPTSKPRRLRGLTLTDLFDMPDPQWLIRRHIHKGTLGVLYGEPGAGKSFYALDMALSVASGKPFVGHEVAPGPVLYIAGEGMAGLKRRAKAWVKAKNNGDVPTNFFLASCRVDLTSVESADLEGLVTLIEQDIQDKPALVIIDTLARAFNGDENSAQDVGKFVAVCDLIRETTGATVLIVHHTGKDGAKGARGSTALLGAADTMLEVKKSKGGIMVNQTKQKDARELPTSILTARSVEVDPDAEDDFDRASLVFDLQAATSTAEQLLKLDVRKFYERLAHTFGSDAFTLSDTARIPNDLGHEINKSTRDRYLIKLVDGGLLHKDHTTAEYTLSA